MNNIYKLIHLYDREEQGVVYDDVNSIYNRYFEIGKYIKYKDVLVEYILNEILLLMVRLFIYNTLYNSNDNSTSKAYKICTKYNLNNTNNSYSRQRFVQDTLKTLYSIKYISTFIETKDLESLLHTNDNLDYYIEMLISNQIDKELTIDNVGEQVTNLCISCDNDIEMGIKDILKSQKVDIFKDVKYSALTYESMLDYD